MLLFSFLLPERKPPRLFRFPLLTAHGLSRQLALLSLQLQGLLGFGPNADRRRLLSRLPLLPLGIAHVLLRCCNGNRWTKLQPIIVFQDKVPNLIVLRLGPERDLADRERSDRKSVV